MLSTKCRHEKDHFYSVQAYCRDIFTGKQNITYYTIPKEMVSIILLFYCSGKSFAMKVKFKNTSKTKSVSYCPAYDNYNSICDKIQISFHKHVKDIHFENDIVNSEIWEECFREWGPDELFTIHGFEKEHHAFTDRIRNNRFKTLEKLRNTLQGHRYVAIDLDNKKQKVILKETYKDLVDADLTLDDGITPFGTIKNEIEILKHLSNQPHLNFCSLIDVWETKDCIYYAMEYAKKELFDYISHNFEDKQALMYNYVKNQAKKVQRPQSRNDSHVWITEIQDIFRQLVECVHWMHSKLVVHLDLSLENCVIIEQGAYLQVKIVGFRCAQYCVCSSNELIGKLGYMAPEVYQCKRDKSCNFDTRKADIWSLGVMLFMMLIGAPLYNKPSETDACCKYVLSGFLEDVLKHWKRLRLVSQDALDCMNKIFRYEKDRITMEELLSHPFVGLRNTSTENVSIHHGAINDAISIYHNNYLLSERYDDKLECLHKIQTQYNKVALLNVFDNVLKCHGRYNLDMKRKLLSDDMECKVNENSGATIENVLQLASSNTEKIMDDTKEDFATIKTKLIEQYRKRIADIYRRKNPQKINKIETWLKKYENNPHELYTKICKKYDLIPESEIIHGSNNKQVTFDDSFCGMYKTLLQKFKNNSFIDLNDSNVITECFRDRKQCKNASDLYRIYGNKFRNIVDDDDYRMCMEIMNKIYAYFAYAFDFGYQFTEIEMKDLTSINLTTLKQQLLQTKKERICKYQMSVYSAIQNRRHKYVTSNNFLNEEKQTTEPKQELLLQDTSIQLFHDIKHKMEEHFYLKNDISVLWHVLLLKCDNKQIKELLLNVLKEIHSIDIENDINVDMLDELFTENNLNGIKFHHMHEEYFILNFIKPSLTNKFDDIDSHKFGKRFRYWPSYANNKTKDLINRLYYNSWYIHPKFQDIKTELLDNTLCSLTVNQWNRIVLYASRVIIRINVMRKLRATVSKNKKSNGRTSNSSYNKYGLKKNDGVRLEHIVPLLVYVNLDFVSKELICTYNNNNYINNNHCMEYKKRHSELTHLSRLIREAVECFGQNLGKDKTLYHIMDKSMPLSSLSTRFCSPTSMTTSLNAAFIFNDFKANEIVLELNGNNNSNLKYFDCSILSDFSNEFEHIVCGGMGILKIVNIYDLYCFNYSYHIQAMRILMNTIENKMKEVICCNNDDNEMKNIGDALNELINIKCKQNPNDNQYIHKLFKQICDKVQYVQINMNDVMLSPLLRDVIYNDKNNSIRFDVLSSVFPNVIRYFIILQECDGYNNVCNNILNADLLDFCDKKMVKSIQFYNVDPKMDQYDNYKHYKQKFEQDAWELNCFAVDNITTLSINYDD